MFEKTIIDTILTLIKDNQEYLTKQENLPQLAKLGYMYNTLWYAGRVCWGYDGIISKHDDCEDNPKYKIEEVEPLNEKIENLVYDAWGMHVSNSTEAIDFMKFTDVLFVDKELTKFERKLLKINKTFDEWVEVLTDKRYKFSSLYKTRRSVANHLLCVIGNGYGLNKEGFVIAEAGGADQDKALYGNWENVRFNGAIEKTVRDLVANPIVKQTLDVFAKHIDNWNKKQNRKTAKEEKEFRESLKRLKPNDMSDKEFNAMSQEKIYDLLTASIKKLEGKVLNKKIEENPYCEYYPICNYSIIDMIIHKDGITPHKSYIKAGIEICKEIVDSADKEERNIKFAKEFLDKIKER